MEFSGSEGWRRLHGRSPSAKGENQSNQPTELWPGTVARLVLLLLVVALPWFSGGVGALHWAWLPILAALFCWALAPEVDAATASYPLALAPILAAVLFGVFQLTPLPEGLLTQLSPKAQQLWNLADLGVREASATAADDLPLMRTPLARPISLYPFATEQSLGLLLIVLCAYLLGARFFRNRLPLQWLFVALAVNGLLLAAFGALHHDPDGGERFGSFLKRRDAGAMLMVAEVAAVGIITAALLRIRLDETVSQRRSPALILGGALAVLIGGGLFSVGATEALLALATGAAVALATMRIARYRWGIPAISAIIVVGVGAAVFGGESGTISQPKPTSRLVGDGWGVLPLLAPHQANSSPLDRHPLGGNQFQGMLREGGAVCAVLLLALLSLETLAVGSMFVHQESDAVAAASGMMLIVAPCIYAWFGAGVEAPANLIALAVGWGALAGRAGILAPLPIRRWIAVPQPSWLPAPTVGVALLAGGFWGCAVAWQSEGVLPLLRKAALSANVDTVEGVEAAIEKLKATPHQGDAVAHWQLAERWIERFQLRESRRRVDQAKIAPKLAWQQTEPGWLSVQAMLHLRANEAVELNALRGAVNDSLAPAREELKAALAATPLLPEASARLAELAFLSGNPTANGALCELTRALAPDDAELLYRTGLQDFFADRLDRAAIAWNRSLLLSPRRLSEIGGMAVVGLGAPATMERILPPTLEILLTFAENVLGGPDHLVTKLLVLEQAERLLAKAELSTAEIAFQTGRLHAGRSEMAQAAAEFRKAVDASPGSTRFRHTLALALEFQGKREESLTEAQQCLDAEPGDPVLHAMVERLKKPAPPVGKKKADDPPGRPAALGRPGARKDG